MWSEVADQKDVGRGAMGDAPRPAPRVALRMVLRAGLNRPMLILGALRMVVQRRENAPGNQAAMRESMAKPSAPQYARLSQRGSRILQDLAPISSAGEILAALRAAGLWPGTCRHRGCRLFLGTPASSPAWSLRPTRTSALPGARPSASRTRDAPRRTGRK